MAADKIIATWKKGNFLPIYWLEGDEPYFIDKVINYAEHHILKEEEAAFNLSIFYGRDANWADIVNACKRYPMFAEKQVVLLKEAQHLKDIAKLESYINTPLTSTIFVVGYKGKIDGRTKFAQTIKAKGEVLSTKKMNDNDLSFWANNIVTQLGLTITQKALMLLIEHIGNDLSRIENELEKLSVNLKTSKNITEDAIEQFIGISKKYNSFELQKALGRKDFTKAMQIIDYFEKNKDDEPIQRVLATLYSFFSKVYSTFSIGTTDKKTIATTLGIPAFFVDEYIQASHNYGYQGVEKNLLLLYECNLKSVGINNASSDSAALMKELIVKMMNNI
ncbi:MAG: DNA polymerase III subunit delta [Chitinophagaceae bacterium]|nr:DNA polymerase III subunit delta [Chitinophagaceae bacterium]MCW5904777.1 DNA polymerase III subunit delta [Chitinophagaceae bacterium]